MSHCLPYNLTTWQKACGVLANSFRGLRELTVHLEGYHVLPDCYDDYSTGAWQPLLDALKGIRVENRFVVFLPWSEEQCAKTTKESSYPFQLVSDPEGVIHISVQ